MTSVARDSLGFRWTGFSPVVSLLIPAFSLLIRPAVLPVCLRPDKNAPLPSVCLSTPCRGFGSVLEPRIFSAQGLSTSELLRTLLMVAASEPTSWLFSKSYILLHLAQHLGP